MTAEGPIGWPPSSTPSAAPWSSTRRHEDLVERVLARIPAEPRPDAYAVVSRSGAAAVVAVDHRVGDHRSRR